MLNYYRVNVNRVKPRLLFFAVEDGLLTEEQYNEFLAVWTKANLPVTDLGGGVLDISVDDINEETVKQSKAKRKLAATVLATAKKIRNTLGG